MNPLRRHLAYPVLLAAAATSLALAAPALAVNTATFEYTGAPQTWTVPAGVTSATFDLYGASGGQTFSASGPAYGGRTTATIPVTPGESLQVYVGGQGQGNSPGSAAFNGGGAATGLNSWGGGGASDVRRDGTELSDRLLVAGGGGGDGGCFSTTPYPEGGTGGGLSGGDGNIDPACAPRGGMGTGGTQSAGGTGGPGPDTGAGALGIGGPAGEYGGGGGGGYYGGGGGKNGGGGGGSGFGPAGTTFETGVHEGNGLVTITYAASPLTVTGAGTGRGYVESSLTGIDCGQNSSGHVDCSQEYSDGTVVTLTAHPGANTEFAGFSGGGCTGSASTCQLTMSEARAVTATFSLEVRPLAVSTTGSGLGYVESAPAGIDCGSHSPTRTECADEPELGSSVTLTAYPEANTLFLGFSGGGCSGAAAVCTVTMSAARSVTATFQLKRTLTVVTSGSGGGTISGPGFDCGGIGHIDCTETVPDGSQVQLTANPAAGAEFTGFTGACSGTVASCTVTVTADSKVEASFATQPVIAPRTTIVFKPTRSGARHSIFQLRSSVPGSSFECRLDGGKFKACGKRVDYPNLKPGRHTFRARAIDAAGIVDPSPAVVRFRVTPPVR